MRFQFFYIWAIGVDIFWKDWVFVVIITIFSFLNTWRHFLLIISWFIPFFHEYWGNSLDIFLWRGRSLLLLWVSFMRSNRVLRNRYLVFLIILLLTHLLFMQFFLNLFKSTCTMHGLSEAFSRLNILVFFLSFVSVTICQLILVWINLSKLIRVR